jgi:hypothetical protein
VAVPTFVAAGTLSAHASGTTVGPVDIPAGAQANDIAVCQFQANNTRNPSPPAPGGQTWTQLGTEVVGTPCSSWYWRRLTGGDTEPTISTSGSGTMTSSIGGYGRIYLFRGCITTGDPFEDVTNTANTTSTTPSSSAIDTTGVDRLAVCLAAINDDPAFSSGNPPALWSVLGTNVGSTTGGDALMPGISRPMASAGNVAAVALGTLPGSDPWRTITFALIPEPDDAAEGDATGAIDWAGTATGTSVHTGSASGAIVWAGTSTGVAVHHGAATGAIGWVGSATGEAPVVVQDGSASGSITWAGTATGTTVRSGAATGTISWAGAATSDVDHEGDGVGALTWAGAATGTTDRDGAATGSIGWAGSATGEAPLLIQDGSATGAITWAGAATGEAGYQGAATGAITWAGSATGITARAGAAAGSIAWVGAALGLTTRQGAATGILEWVGTATGEIPPEFLLGTASTTLSSARAATTITAAAATTSLTADIATTTIAPGGRP